MEEDKIHLKVKNKKSGVFIKEQVVGWIFVMPLILGILIFVIYPVIYSFILSLQRTNGVIGEYIGFLNYAYILQDPSFWLAVFNTIYLGISTLIVNIGVSFIVACMINNTRFAKNFFKSVYFLPNVVSIVAVSILFSFIFYPNQQGLLNYILSAFKIEPIGWFADPKYARLGIILMGLWASIGYYIIIFLAGLQNVSRELYEAARVDGCTGIRTWWYITIPSVKPIFVFVIMTGTIAVMKRFGDVWMIGGNAGNPSGTLSTIVLYIYRNAFYATEVGIASSAAYILFIIILVLTLLNNKFLNKSNVE